MVKFKKMLVGFSICFLTLGLSTGYLSANENSVVTVHASNVNLRSGPSLSNKVVELLQKGNKLTVLTHNGSWYKVSTSSNNIGWVKNNFVSSTNSSSAVTTSTGGTVNASSVNLRSDSRISSRVIGILQKGNNLKVLAQNGDWLKVSTSNHNIGWVKKDFVSLTQSVASRNSAKNLASRGETTRTFSEHENIINYAKSLQGVRYVWGGSSPNGFDCSGYVKYVYQKFGINLNRTAADQAQQGTYISKANLNTGDLVFFDTNGGHNYINHVGIYIGNGMFIQSSSGAGRVIISSLNEGFYARNYMTARRVF